MARPPAPHVTRADQAMRNQIASGRLLPGQRFLSARQVAERYGISYQTAHRVLARLEDDGLLCRRDRSGTYVAGRDEPFKSVALIFNPRGVNPRSFGERLRSVLTAGLSRAGIEARTLFENNPPLKPSELPILWEAPAAAERLNFVERPYLMLNEASATEHNRWCSPIEVDNFRGGRLAAEHLRQKGCRAPLVIGGPKRDLRSRRRIEGFLSVFPDAQIHHNRTWFFDEAVKMTFRIRLDHFDGAFCCNDRLAEGLIRSHIIKHAFPIVGFDDSPIATTLGLTTVSFPWDECAQAVTQLAQSRIQGSQDLAQRTILLPYMAIRGEKA